MLGHGVDKLTSVQVNLIRSIFHYVYSYQAERTDHARKWRRWHESMRRTTRPSQSRHAGLFSDIGPPFRSLFVAGGKQCLKISKSGLEIVVLTLNSLFVSKRGQAAERVHTL